MHCPNCEDSEMEITKVSRAMKSFSPRGAKYIYICPGCEYIFPEAPSKKAVKEVLGA